MPEHLRVLVRRDGHLHDQRLPLYPGVRLLPGRHRPSCSSRSRRAGQGGTRRWSAWDWPTRSSPAWPATTYPTVGQAALPMSSTRSGAAPPGRPSRCSSRIAKVTQQSLAVVFDARPDVLNHNIETVARLQRAVRPSAGYARSLGVLARAKESGLTTKSGIILGMGEHRGRGTGHPGRSPGGRNRHRHRRPVPASDRPPSTGRPLVDPRGVRGHP